jgi:hypothetical protein
VTDAHEKVCRQRRAILNLARKMAHSGQHADCSSIETILREVEGFDTAQGWFADWAFRAQLNTLCALVRDKRDVSKVA